MALNVVTIMGRIVADPELRKTQSGTDVISFTIAVDRDIKSKDGERATDFIDVAAWKQTAEFISKYFHKGSAIVVNGRLQTRKYQTKEGYNRVAVEVLAENVYFGESKPKQSGNNQETSTYSGGFVELEDVADLPF